MTRPTIIGLTGYAGSGKDTVRSILVRRHEYDGLAFADPIREMLGGLLESCGVSETWMTERELKEREIPAIGASYRQLAQLLGTEWGRSIHPDFWLKIAAAKIDMYRSFGSKGVVISDCRFPNEAAWIRANGGRIWNIVRPGLEPVRAHASEDLIASLPYDYVIYNKGAIDDLPKAIEAALDYPYDGLAA